MGIKLTCSWSIIFLTVLGILVIRILFVGSFSCYDMYYLWNWKKLRKHFERFANIEYTITVVYVIICIIYFNIEYVSLLTNGTSLWLFFFLFVVSLSGFWYMTVLTLSIKALTNFAIFKQYINLSYIKITRIVSLYLIWIFW